MTDVKLMRCLMVFILTFCAYASAEHITPFTTDGCSAFPDGTFDNKELWLPCCIAHDYAYWQGGTYQQRLDADNQLRKCVSEVGEVDIANLMLLGVRVGGSPLFLTPFRWGYGWPFPRWYQALSADEKEQIHHLSNQLPPE